MTTIQAGAAVFVDDGATVVDVDGTEYLDAMAGLWCVNIGYGRPDARAAVPLPQGDEYPRRPRRARERAPRRRQPRLLRSLGVGGDEAGFKIARQGT